ncbi:MAG TPA: CPBP family intramembrane metalloprotease [Phycisphaerae bacterium]|nr:CPBP family intramembrane metalloprotease [Phycisphaerae bacterium]HNU44722.1 CPBP family intramembrane metalloprotease [Phycisphaerae bacterium]
MGLGTAAPEYSPEPLWQPLAAAGFLALVGIVVIWRVRAKGDPLAAAPRRGNTLLPESILWAIAAYLAASVVLQWATRLVWPIPIDPDTPDPVGALEGTLRQDALRAVVATNGAAILGGLAVLTIIGRRFEGGARQFWSGRRRLGRGLLWVAGVTVAAAVLCNLTSHLTAFAIHWAWPEFEFAEHTVIEVLHSGLAPLGLVVLAWAGAVAIAPVAEEMFFRGMLQTFLVTYLSSRWVAILLTAVAFATVHSQVQHLPALVLLAVLLGVAYERTGAIWVPVAAHALFNLSTLVGLAVFGGRS